MKKLLITALLSGGIAAGAYAQGLVALDNDAANPNATPTSTSGGLFFLQATPGGPIVKISGDFNAAFYGGTDSANLSLIASFNGAAAVGSSFFGDGTWTDPNGKTYTVPGLENAAANSSGTAFFKVEAWTGAASSYLAAIAAGAPAGTVGSDARRRDADLLLGLAALGLGRPGDDLPPPPRASAPPNLRRKRPRAL